MSTEDATKVLGLASSCSFDEVLAKKNQLLEEAGLDQDRQAYIEKAYDALLMQSMRKRLSGEAPVSSTTRWADVPEQRRRSTQAAQRKSTNATLDPLPKLPVASPPLAVAEPKQSFVVQHSAVLGTLGVWCIVQAVLESPGARQVDIGETQLSMAVIYSLYVLTKSKRLGMGKALVASLSGLVLGTALGTTLWSGLMLETSSLGDLQSSGMFCTQSVCATLWLMLLVLRA